MQTHSLPVHDDLLPPAPTRAQVGAGPASADVFTEADIDRLELHRARHALAYLTGRIGNDAMRALLADDLDRTTRQAAAWLADSHGRWRSGVLTLTTPGPPAAEFRDWFVRTLDRGAEELFRAGHPEHFVDHPHPDGRAEVVENFGEDDLPWQIFCEFTDTGTRFPTPWDPSFAAELGFGCRVLDREGREVASVMHELRDALDTRDRRVLVVKLTVHVPEAAPRRLVSGHLRHFAIEFRNWTDLARRTRAGDRTPPGPGTAP